MKITHTHPESRYGIPVILDDHGAVMTYTDGIRTIRRRLKLTTRQIADVCGNSHRTVEGWETGVKPSAQALNALSLLDISPPSAI